MKTGLLLCDHVAENLLSVDGDYPGMFERLFPKLSFEVYPVCDGIFPESVEECDAYLVSGSRFSVYDDVPWVQQLKKFVQEIQAAEKYYVGICFGHQMLAEALGGKVLKAKTGWCIGVHDFNIVQKKDWMIPAKEKLSLLMMCQDQVMELPEGGMVLAQNSECKVGMFQVGNKMLGVQAHPEFAKAYNKILMEQRVDRMGEEKVKEGLLSLEKETDSKSFASWVYHFLNIT